MTHNIFLSKNNEELALEDYIGQGETVEEIFQTIHNYLERCNINNEFYWRFFCNTEITIIDFGSWSQLIIIQPALTEEEVF